MPPKKNTVDSDALSDVLDVYLAMNGYLTHRKPSRKRSPSMKSGNHPVLILPNAPNIAPSIKAAGGVHDVLRETFKKIGALFDITQFSEAMQKRFAHFQTQKIAYKAETQILKKIFDSVYGITRDTYKKKINHPLYNTLEELYLRLDDVLEKPDAAKDVRRNYKKAKAAVDRKNQKMKTTLNRLEEGLFKAKTFRLKDDATDIPNKAMDAENRPVVLWLFYLNLARDGIMDRTKQPECLTQRIQKNVGITDIIVKNAVDILKKNPLLLQPPLADILKEGVVKFKDVFVQTGHTNGDDFYTNKALMALGIKADDGKEIADQVPEGRTMKEKSSDAVIKCPFFQAQKKTQQPS